MIQSTQLIPPQTRGARHLLDLQTVTGLLDKSSRDVCGLIEEGRLLYAFDLRGRGAARAFVRILDHSVFNYSQNNQAVASRQGDTEKDLLTVISWILPAPSVWQPEPAFTACELARAFNCGGTHILNLIADGLLRTPKGSHARRGPTGSPLVTLASATKFLEERRML